jgi:transposase
VLLGDLNFAAGLRLDDLVLTPSTAVALLVSTSPSAACPRCGTPSGSVHSRYRRTVADLPCQNRLVALRLLVRKFRCQHPGCEQRIFCERLPGLLAAHARTTARLTDAHRAIGFALGGEAGARLADRLDMPTSPDTLLRRVKGAPEEPSGPVRFVGLDDWAWRKGHYYGTIVVDLERGRVIDLLPDRDQATAERWLREHPEVEVVSRDRWSAYAQAAANAAPGATQVADRWHLLKNLREAVERLIERHARAIEAALPAMPPPPTGDPGAAPQSPAAAAPVGPKPSPSSEAPPARAARRGGRRQRAEQFDRARALHRQGHSSRRIAKELGLSRTTVLGYLRRASCPDWRPGRWRRSELDGHRDWIDGRIRGGCTNAAQLYRELRARGCRLGPAAVRKFVRKRFAAAGRQRGPAGAPQPPPPPRPSARQLSFAWASRPDSRTAVEQARAAALRAAAPALAEGLDVADGFAALVRRQAGETLAEWLRRAEASPVPELRRFAQGVRRDEAAVRAAVTQLWSNGPVEGQVNRLKLIKRSMYGRAGFSLLRARVLHAT